MKRIFLFAGTEFINYQRNREMIHYLLDALIKHNFRLITYGYEGGPIGDILQFIENKNANVTTIYCNETRSRRIRSRKFEESQVVCTNLIEQKEFIFTEADSMILLPGADIEVQTDFLLMHQFMIYKHVLKPMAIYNVDNQYALFIDLIKANYQNFFDSDYSNSLIVESNPWKAISMITEYSQHLSVSKH